MNAQYEIREESSNRLYPFIVVDLSDNQPIRDRFASREDAQKRIDGLTEMFSDFSVLGSIYGDDPANEHVLEEVQNMPVQEPPALADEIIIDGQNEVGSVIEYKGEKWLVTLSEYTSAQDVQEDVTNEVEGLSVGWHSWLKRVVHYLYKQSGQEYTVKAKIIGSSGKDIQIEFPHPEAKYPVRRWLRTAGERARILDYEIPKRGAPVGNQNARLGEHSGTTIRLNVATIDLLYEFFASEGNVEPSREDIQNAVYYAIRQVYGRQLEDQKAVIV